MRRLKEGAFALQSGTQKCSGTLRGLLKISCLLILTSLMFLSLDSGQAFAANRTLRLYNAHTKESATITYMRNGKYDRKGLRQLDHFMRDWRRNESTQMDPNLYDLLWEISRKTGGKKPIHVVSGYRSPATNSMLRKRSRSVAENSQHTKGHAIDFFIPGVSIKKTRNAALRLQSGGVGYYPTSNSPFVHIDTASVRHWPRLSRRELASIFPDGKTVHIPSNGKPLSRYKQAKAIVDRHKAQMARTAKAIIKGKSSVSRVKVASISAKPKSANFLDALVNRKAKAKPPKAIPAPRRQVATARPSEPSKKVPLPLLPPQQDLASAQLEPGTETAMPRQLRILPRYREVQTERIVMAKAEPQDIQPTVRPQNEIAQAGSSAMPIPMAPPASEMNDQSHAAGMQLAVLPKPRENLAENNTFSLETGAVTPELVDMGSTSSIARTAMAEEKEGNDQLAAAHNADSIEKTPVMTARAEEPTTPRADKQQTITANMTAKQALASVIGDKIQVPKNKPNVSNRIAYAETGDLFTAQLPKKAPVRILPEAKKTLIDEEKKSSDKLQLASLSPTPNHLSLGFGSAIASPSPYTDQEVYQTSEKERKSAEKKTLARTTSGLSNVMRNSQPAKSASFAQLSKPDPSNFSQLVSKPDQMIDQSFTFGPLARLEDNRFSGRAIQQLSVRKFSTN